MKYLGLAFLLIGAFFISREYSKYIQKRLAECEGFLLFIKHMRRQVGCFLKPPCEIGEGFVNKPITPFLLALGDSESVHSAYLSSKDSFSLSLPEDRTLTELFSSIGSCYAGEGIKLLDSSVEKFELLYRDLSQDSKRSTRLVATLTATLAVGIFILVV